MAHLIIGNKKEKAVWYSDNDYDGTSNKHWMAIKSVKYLLFYNIIRGFYDSMAVVVLGQKNRSIRLRRIVNNAKTNKLLINSTITFYF